MSEDVDIAVVGIGCRFPDAWNPQQFWANIDNGVVSMRPLDQLPADHVPVATTLPGYDQFAAEFFGVPPREAAAMDPQQRIFLETAWEALEFAGHPADGPVVGVFAGSAASPYQAARIARAVSRVGLAAAVNDIEIHTGGEPDFLTSRAAYKLGLRGPAVSVQTACSSSLYAVHYASLSLLAGECDIALAGGATVLEPVLGHRYVPGRGLSEDGYCRSFDHRSQGTAYSSGVGVVALRRLSDALADGDPILAVVRGTAVGNDGAHKAGYAAPDPVGVEAVVAGALRVADVPADLLRYVEAHGTATPLGDEIELAALTAAVRRTTAAKGFCALGSVKANIGHSGPAAGIAGFIKAVHIARTGALPPHPMFERTRESLEDGPFVIATTGGACPDPERHVLVNAIGMGGANAAAVLAPPPEPTVASAPATETVRLVLSARTRVELDRLSANLSDVIEKNPADVHDIAHTLRVGRRHFDERRVITARPDQLVAALRMPRPPLAQTMRRTNQPAPNAATIEEAWLHGAEIDWNAFSVGRRLPLPTYPFERQRFWLLDDFDLEPAAPAAVDDIEREIQTVWRELFGVEDVGPDDEFGAMGGTSLLSVQLVLELQTRFGVLVNLHRVGGDKTTARRLARVIRGLRTEDEPDDANLIDQDLQLPLGPIAPNNRGRDLLLTGATGFLGAFVLAELLASTTGRVYCLVRADDEAAALERLAASAAKFRLPAPDPERVHPVPGDLRDIAKIGPSFRDGELETRVGHVVHCAARVVFTERYRTLREDNVVPMADLLAWCRSSGIADFSHVSTLTATARPAGSDRVLEIRDQGLAPGIGGYGTTKWVCERLLDRADEEGLRVRVFRPGLIMSAASGAASDTDLIYFVLASGIAVGAHPTDDRWQDMAPVDVVAKAVAQLAVGQGSVGRAYHLIGQQRVSVRDLFAMLAEAGLPTRPVSLAEWQELVRAKGIATGNPIMATAGLLELKGTAPDALPPQAVGWQPFLRRAGVDSAVITGDLLRRGLVYLAATNPLFAELLTP
ncbi:beta-ketoacyl synthase N-terminal-like domain-containing protein [Kutzneria sp. NPDC052558]|uniref:beta-ketoacyl synthase N-terminal-like domain-containing protein n=1 Tax=Kutzneria sp. NPDC052558 TaxID=3364121 RepID=UPI0037C50A38